MFFLIFLLFLGIRLFAINSIPAAFTHDEIYYVAEAQALATSGRGLDGIWQPWSLTPSHSLFAELPSTIMIPANLIFNNPILAAKFTPVLLGSLFPFVLAAFSHELFKNKKLSLITLLVAGFNPWLFQMSRLGYDALFSLFFLFLGAYLLLKLKTRQKLWALIPLFLGFYQYQGLKIIFLPLILSLILYQYNFGKIKNKTNLILLIILLASFSLFVFYLVNLAGQSAGERVSSVLIFNKELLNKALLSEQLSSFANPLGKIFSNKLLTIIKLLLKGYFSTFNPVLLFVAGESVRNPNSVWTHGNFYLLDFILILTGLIKIWSKKIWRKQAYLLSFLILIAPLPVALNSIDIWVQFRGSLLIPLLVILASFGFYTLSKINQKIFNLLIIFYLFFISLFFYEYFYRYPIYSTKGPYFAKRVLANYLIRLPQNQEVLMMGNETSFLFTSILGLSGEIKPVNLPQIHEAYQNKNYQLNNWQVAASCINHQDLEAGKIIIIDDSVSPCPNSVEEIKKYPSIAVASIIDSSEIYTIYGDQLCNKFTLPTFLHLTQNLLAVERLTNAQLCQNFFIPANLTTEWCEAQSGLVKSTTIDKECPSSHPLRRKIESAVDQMCCFKND